MAALSLKYKEILEARIMSGLYRGPGVEDIFFIF